MAFSLPIIFFYMYLYFLYNFYEKFSGWTVGQYSDWLDEHSEEGERMTLLRFVIFFFSFLLFQTDLRYVILKASTKLTDPFISISFFNFIRAPLDRSHLQSSVYRQVK